MKLEKIINILGECLNTKLIIRRISLPHPTFKVYNSYTIELYEIISNKPILLHTYNQNYKVNSPKELEEIEEKFLKEIFIKYGIQQVSNTIN